MCHGLRSGKEEEEADREGESRYLEVFLAGLYCRRDRYETCSAKEWSSMDQCGGFGILQRRLVDSCLFVSEVFAAALTDFSCAFSRISKAPYVIEDILMVV